MSFLTYNTADNIISSLEIIEKLLFLETDFWHDNYLKGMWYLRKAASSCKQCGPVSTCLYPKYITFRFQNLRNSREDVDVDRLLLVSKLKESSILTKYIGIFFFIFKPKNSLSTSVFIFYTISIINQIC